MLFASLFVLLFVPSRVKGFPETLNCYHCGSETDSGWDLPCEKFNSQPLFEGPCSIDHFCFKTISNSGYCLFGHLPSFVYKKQYTTFREYKSTPVIKCQTTTCRQNTYHIVRGCAAKKTAVDTVIHTAGCHVTPDFALTNITTVCLCDKPLCNNSSVCSLYKIFFIFYLCIYFLENICL